MRWVARHVCSVLWNDCWGDPPNNGSVAGLRDSGHRTDIFYIALTGMVDGQVFAVGPEILVQMDLCLRQVCMNEEDTEALDEWEQKRWKYHVKHRSCFIWLYARYFADLASKRTQQDDEPKVSAVHDEWGTKKSPEKAARAYVLCTWFLPKNV